MWIYLPMLLLLVVSLVLPHQGPNQIGKQNFSEFALLLAFWWLVLAIGWRVVRSAWSSTRTEADERRGFDVVRKE